MPINEEELSKNIAIFISTNFKILYSIPRKLLAILASLSIIIGLFTSIFEYEKLEIATVFNSFTISIVVILLLLSFLISLCKGFYDYIDEKEKKIEEMEKSISENENDFRNKLELIREQYNEQPIFMDKNLIKNLIREIENYIYLKNNAQITEEFLPILEVKLVNNKRIEITAINRNNFYIDKRMIFELYHRKSILGHPINDAYGLVSVIASSGESFKAILIDVQPEESYWEKIFHDLKENKCINCDELYLKIYIPENVLRTNITVLNNIIEGLKNYE